MKKRLLYAIAVSMLAAGIILVATILVGSNDGDDDGDLLSIGTPFATRSPVTSTPSPRPSQGSEPEPTSTPAPRGDPRLAALDISRLVIPSIGVDAPIIYLSGTRTPNGIVMDAPDNAVDVAWYTFTARPGQIGNVVMAGHLDYVPNLQGVFWDLDKIRPGDEIQLIMEDGTLVKYVVEGLQEYDEATAPIRDIVYPDVDEAITLITCAGSFDPNNLHYNRRLVVRGARVTESALNP